MSSENKYDVVVVGAGLAGLASALRLNKKGHNVLVLEKNSTPGGKLAELNETGFRWDQGPSLLTEPENIIELFELYDRNASDYFEFEKHDESCRYFFNDKTSITLSSDKKRAMDSIQKIASEEDVKSYDKYISTSKVDYKNIGALFLNDVIPPYSSYLHPKFMKHYPFLLSKKMFKSLDHYNNSMFESEKMRLIFNRFGTYNGSNPYQMSGLYSMIPSLELTDGTYFPKNGIRSIIDALYKLALEEKIEFEFNAEAQIQKEASGYHYSTSNNTNGSCNSVVCAMDHITFYNKVLKDDSLSAKYKKQERSTSGLVFYWGIDTKIEQLGLHNIFFSDDYKKEFDTLFVEQKNSEDPTIYIHISSILNPSDAPINGQNLFVMINTSSYEDVDQGYRDRMKDYVINKLKAQFNIDIRKHIVVENFWDNASIESITGSHHGALYGASSNKINSAYKRHPNASKKYKNLFFCGGTVHPGGGIPLVLRSSKIVANSIQ